MVSYRAGPLHRRVTTRRPPSLPYRTPTDHFNHPGKKKKNRSGVLWRPRTIAWDFPRTIAGTSRNRLRSDWSKFRGKCQKSRVRGWDSGFFIIFFDRLFVTHKNFCFIIICFCKLLFAIWGHLPHLRSRSERMSRPSTPPRTTTPFQYVMGERDRNATQTPAVAELFARPDHGGGTRCRNAIGAIL